MKKAMPWDNVIHIGKYFLNRERRSEWNEVVLEMQGTFQVGWQSLSIFLEKVARFWILWPSLLNLAPDMWGTSLPQKFHLLLEISL